MKFMMFYRPDRETLDMPKPEHMATMGAYVEKSYASGVLLDTGGLTPAARGARVRIAGGKFTVSDGPPAVSTKLMAGYAVINAKSLADAVEHGKRFLAIAGDGETEVRPMFDMPGSGTPPRFMMLYRPDADQETACAPSPEHMAAMGKYVTAMFQEGVLISTGGLEPSSKGARVRLGAGKVTITDGPFTETKELVAGYAQVQVKDLPDAIEHAKTFLAIAGDGICEIRSMHDAG
jgi:hypothetical protein